MPYVATWNSRNSFSSFGSFPPSSLIHLKSMTLAPSLTEGSPFSFHFTRCLDKFDIGWRYYSCLGQLGLQWRFFMPTFFHHIERETLYDNYNNNICKGTAKSIKRSVCTWGLFFVFIKGIILVRKYIFILPRMSVGK